jgi:predicted transcriptional regulator
MNKLVVSVKSTSQVLADAKRAFKDVKENKRRASKHTEISFTDIREFKKFVNNLDVLVAIRRHKPQSIYELANLLERDPANINRIVGFFENVGVIATEVKIVGGRSVKTPIVNYSKIEWDLVA